MEGKTCRQTSVVMVQSMTPQEANFVGNVNGRVIMKLIDEAAGIIARRHAQGNAVTASIDRLDFHHPVYIGDVLTLKASLNLVGRTSMEAGVHVNAENPMTGEVRHTASAYVTLVAIGENRKPMSVPPLILETEEEIRRNREAQVRRETRITH